MNKYLFKIAPQLEADTVWLTKLELSQLRLMNNAHYTWLILVPEVLNAVEFIDLNESQQQKLLAEITQVSHILKNHFPCDKLNIAMIGNIVSQLHIHIIARRQDDISWPNPVWGGPKIAYTDQGKTDTIAKLKRHLDQA